MHRDPVVVAHGLRKRYAGFAPVLRGVDIEVCAGEMVAIMGPSGCGKSTMLHVLGMLHAPDSGTLSILGQDVLSFSRQQTADFRRGNVGFIMQASNLFSHSTVFENVEFPLIYENVPSAERWPRVIRALELVRLSARVHYPSNRLSGGEQQRVAIARAMVNNPRILMADEPTGALDQRTSRLIMENFRSLCHASGVALVMVTHDAKMADYCDSVYTLEEGLLVCQKHSVPEISADAGARLLAGPETKIASCLVADNFLKQGACAIRSEAHLLHNEGLLARTATLAPGSLLGKDMQNYALPMPVRHFGGVRSLSLWGAFFGFGALPRTDSSWKASLPALRPLGRGAWSRAKARALAAWSLACGVECLYAAGGKEAPFVAWLASRLAGIPFALEARTTDGWLAACQDADAKGKAWQEAFRTLCRDAVFVRCDTLALAEALAQAAGPDLAGKIAFVPDIQTLAPMDEETLAAQHREKRVQTHFLCAGEMAARKGYDKVLKAFSRLKALGLEAKLTMAGAGPELKRLRRQAKALGLAEDVVFPGYVPHENIASLYLDADVFLAPGIAQAGGPSDGVPSAMAEAMAFYVPVVASDLPGQAWMLDGGRAGILVPQGDEEKLAQAMERLCRDREERARLGAAGQERASAVAREASASLAQLFAPLAARRRQSL